MLNEMMSERLQDYLATTGRAHSILHYGPKVTPQLEARLEFDVASGSDTYDLRLSYAAGDTLIFAEETLSSNQNARAGNLKVLSLGAGHQETRVVTEANRGEPTPKVFRSLLNNCRVYHFHDTSTTARVRQYGYIADNRPLLPDAGNLAAFLYRLKNQDRSTTYPRIVSPIRTDCPVLP